MPLFFFFKKGLGYLLAPGTVIFLLLVLGLLLLCHSRGQHSGRPWLVLGTLSFYLFTTGPLPEVLLSRLERQHEPLLQVQHLPEIKYLVVLSSDRRDNPDAPPTSLLDEVSALRVVEGIRLFRLLQGQPTLIMSGGNDCGPRMAAFAQSLGVPPDKLLVEARSLDTHGNAREVKPLVQHHPFLLVTSASHLPRALKIFRLLGLQPVPAPADFRTPGRKTIDAYFPAGHHLTATTLAVHEYLGLAYLALFPDRAGR